MKTWIEDENGNRASVERWGSKELARRALGSLRGCSRCSDCSRCSRCSDCSDLKKTDATEGPIKPPAIPIIEKIHGAVYAAASSPQSLEVDAWHTCAKTHCRGGWIVTLAGDAGKELERFYNTELAAMLIYDASDPAFKINPARFYDDNEAALADMKRLADLEAALARSQIEKDDTRGRPLPEHMEAHEKARGTIE
jgi:hypothetical protein